MVMASTVVSPSNAENSEKSKNDGSQQAVDSGPSLEGRRQARRFQQTDLSGFIGAEGWMVGKYER
jgi:hypothetical protein